MNPDPNPTPHRLDLQEAVKRIDDQLRFAKHTIIRIENDEMARAGRYKITAFQDPFYTGEAQSGEDVLIEGESESLEGAIRLFAEVLEERKQRSATDLKISQRVHWDGRELRAELHRYAEPDNWGIVLFHGNEQYATATFNPDQRLENNLVAIKTWDDQETIAEALADAGIISRSPVSRIQLQFDQAPVHQILFPFQSEEK